MRESGWIQESYGTYRVLCFDKWSDGLEEAWTVSLVQEDIDYILDELRGGKRNVFTQDLLADYDSEHHDLGSDGYKALEAEVEDGKWTPISEFVTGNP